jgi:PhnB protein
MATENLYAYLVVDGAAAAIAFYESAFSAKEKFRLTEPGGRIGHAELDFDDATLMLADEFPEFNLRGPKHVGGTSVSLHLHVHSADEVIERATNAGATLERAASDQFFGERSGAIIDPFGHRWIIGHSIEKVTPEEMQRRYSSLMSG